MTSLKTPGKDVVVAWTILALVLVSLNASHTYFTSGIGRQDLLSGMRVDEQESRPRLRRLPEISKGEEGKERKRAFVCITGQLSRLELNNKEEHLFRHWHDNFDVDFDVALVLSETNYSSVRRGGTIDQTFFNSTEVANHLNTLPGVTVLNNDDFVAAEDPVVNQKYFEQRSADNRQSSEQKLQRIQNHVRQFESLAKCYYHMSQSPLAAGKYDIVHRIRDDSGYYLPVPFDRLFNMTQKQPKTMVSSSCQQHLGVNDRGSFVSPQAAFDYFVHPIIYMYTQPLPSDVRSTELFLMNTYSKTSHLVETHQFRMFRIFTTTYHGSKYYSGTDIPRLLPGTNFDSEYGALDRCIEGLDSDEPRRDAPRCHEFADGNTVCVEIA